MAKKSHTIHDVARTAGVGVGTVSRVLNNSQSVKDSTREKVLRVISDLNFTPDPIARTMIKKRSGTLGVILPFFTRPFFIELLRNIEAAISRRNCEMVIYNVETDEQRERYFNSLPMRRKVDGLLLVSLSPGDDLLPRLRDAELPTVLIDAYNPHFTSLVVNNIDGAYTAVRHLIQKGHRRIGFINGIIEGNFKFNQANDRLIGVHRALSEGGVQYEPELMLAADWNRHSAKEAALKLLRLPNPPTAIFVASDLQAVGVLEAARQQGLRVPDELSVVGFDGIELSDILDLTTIQQPYDKIGEIGVRKLLELIDKSGEVPPELIRFDTHLVERKTVAPPRS
jgi:LacI family transcriptional regulator